MLEQLIKIDKHSSDSLKDQIKQSIASAVLDRLLPFDKAIPSSRKLANALHVSRQTVMFAFDELVDDGYLIAKQRRGYFVNADILSGQAAQSEPSSADTVTSAEWSSRFSIRPSLQRNIAKPADWQRYPYPFLTGQIDPKTFPIAQWRECSKQALNVLAVRDWTNDSLDADDPLLIEQIQSRVLPRRGIWAKSEEILVTVGTQQSLYLLSHLLGGRGRSVMMENPGYPDARNIFNTHFDTVHYQPVDHAGIVVNADMEEADYVYVTPSHQWPTSVTMPVARRRALLEHAQLHDFIVIEDDYEIETSYSEQPLAALKSLDTSDRVIYMSSLSKFLAPGLRLGFMVGPKALIDEARVLRRLMIRHPALNNQRMTGLFLQRGHYEALVKRLWRIYQNNWLLTTDAVRTYLPQCRLLPVNGGTSCWVKGPDNLNCYELQSVAKANGILIEVGDIAFAERNGPKHYFRLGFTVIDPQKIAPGIRKLGELIEKIT